MYLECDQEAKNPVITTVEDAHCPLIFVSIILCSSMYKRTCKTCMCTCNTLMQGMHVRRHTHIHEQYNRDTHTHHSGVHSEILSSVSRRLQGAKALDLSWVSLGSRYSLDRAVYFITFSGQ